MQVSNRWSEQSKTSKIRGPVIVVAQQGVTQHHRLLSGCCVARTERLSGCSAFLVVDKYTHPRPPPASSAFLLRFNNIVSTTGRLCRKGGKSQPTLFGSHSHFLVDKAESKFAIALVACCLIFLSDDRLNVDKIS